MAAIPKPVAECPESPVYGHGYPYPHQPTVKIFTEKVCKPNPETPHGNNGYEHGPDHIPCRTQSVGQCKGGHPENNGKYRMPPDDLHCKAFRLGRQLVNFHHPWGK